MPGLPNHIGSSSGTGFGSLLVGLQEGSTAYGSGEVPLNGHTVAGTAVALTFQAAALDSVIPIELHIEFFDGTTQVAGEYVTSLDGETDLTGATARVSASVPTVIQCYDLFKQAGTLYVAPDADPGADGFMYYKIIYGNRKGG